MTQQTDQILPPTSGPSSPENKFFEQVRNWLAAPVFSEDEEKNRKAAILNTLLLGALASGVIFGLTLPWSTPNGLSAVLFVLAAIAIFGFGLFNLRRGNLNSSVYLTVIVSWLLAAGASAFFGGVSSPVYASFLIIILAVGLLLGHRTAILFTAISILYGLFLLFLENSNALPEFKGNSVNYLLYLSITFVFASFLIFLIGQNILQALKNSEQSRAALQESNQEIKAKSASLETSAVENAHLADRQKLYLDAAAEIARITTTSTNLDQTLGQITNLIAARFSYYHVGIFLTEESGVWTYLHSASSDGGKNMIARNHRLGVGKQGIVGYVTSIGQARISQDIGLDRIHSVTPELPETRSEMALPLKARGEILGALDIQEKASNAFNEQDVAALQILADQIGLAIDNARLYQQAQEKQEEVDRVYGEYSQRAWSETHRQHALAAYRFLDGELIPISDPSVKINSLNKLDIPILVRGNKIGAIEIAKEDPQAQWTREEQELLQTLSDQLGIALDSARLFNETQLRASTEQIIGDINAEIYESLEIGSILRTTVQKLQQSLNLPEVSIKMSSPVSGPQPTSNGNPLDADEN